MVGETEGDTERFGRVGGERKRRVGAHEILSWGEQHVTAWKYSEL